MILKIICIDFINIIIFCVVTIWQIEEDNIFIAGY